MNQLHLVRQDGGQWVVRHHRVAFFDGATQIYKRLLQCFFTGRLEQMLCICPGARIRQQILDQPLHAAGTVHCECNEFIGIRVELSLIPPR